MASDKIETDHYLYLKTIFFIALVAIIIVFSSYFFIFNDGISSKQALWGSFGDYIGGTLNPILSFLALLALLVTIAIQSKQLSLSRRELELTKLELAKTAEATMRQAKHLENEARRLDLYRIIEILSTRINKNYNDNRIEPVYHQQENISIHHVMKKGNDKSKNDMLVHMCVNYKNVETDTHRTIKWMESDLERLSFYIAAYEKETKTTKSSTPLPYFYKSEFGDLVSSFHNLKLFKDSIYEFYCYK